MKDYDFFEKKYLMKMNIHLMNILKMLVHMRRMDNEKEYREAVEARLYRLEGWEQQWEKLGLS